MKNFEKAMNLFMDTMEDMAGALYDDAEVKAYFVEHYGYNEEMDDAVHMLVKYIEDKYC